MPFHKLDVYRKAYDLSLQVYRQTLQFPKFEQFELAGQLRRSSRLICANLAEGMGRQSSAPEVVRFVRIALGSCDETRIWLEYSRDLGYVDATRFKTLYDGYCEVGRMLNGLVAKWSARAADLSV